MEGNHDRSSQTFIVAGPYFCRLQVAENRYEIVLVSIPIDCSAPLRFPTMTEPNLKARTRADYAYFLDYRTRWSVSSP